MNLFWRGWRSRGLRVCFMSFIAFFHTAITTHLLLSGFYVHWFLDTNKQALLTRLLLPLSSVCILLRWRRVHHFEWDMWGARRLFRAQLRPAGKYIRFPVQCTESVPQKQEPCPSAVPLVNMAQPAGGALQLTQVCTNTAHSGVHCFL